MIKAKQIGTQTGIVATKNALASMDPGHRAAYEKQAATLDELVTGHNEGLERMASLEEKLATLPFLIDPGLWVAWGLNRHDFTVRAIFEKARAHGLGWVAVQDGDPDHPNDEFYPACRTEADRLGMRFGLWSQPPRHERAVWAVGSARPDFFIANIETDFDLAAFDADVFRDVHPTIETACATNFGAFVTTGIGDDHRKAAPLQRNGFDCIGEAYANDNPQATPDAMQARARHCWWPGCSVVLGAGWGAAQQRLSQYEGVQLRYPWSVYTAETLDADDWATIGRWAGA